MNGFSDVDSHDTGPLFIGASLPLRGVDGARFLLAHAREHWVVDSLVRAARDAAAVVLGYATTLAIHVEITCTVRHHEGLVVLLQSRLRHVCQSLAPGCGTQVVALNGSPSRPAVIRCPSSATFVDKKALLAASQLSHRLVLVRRHHASLTISVTTIADHRVCSFRGRTRKVDSAMVDALEGTGRPFSWAWSDESGRRSTGQSYRGAMKSRQLAFPLDWAPRSSPSSKQEQ